MFKKDRVFIANDYSTLRVVQYGMYVHIHDICMYVHMYVCMSCIHVYTYMYMYVTHTSMGEMMAHEGWWL